MNELSSRGWEHLHLSGIVPPDDEVVLEEIGRLVQRIQEVISPHFDASHDGYMKCEREWRETLKFSDLGEAAYMVELFRSNVGKNTTF